MNQMHHKILSENLYITVEVIKQLIIFNWITYMFKHIPNLAIIFQTLY